MSKTKKRIFIKVILYTKYIFVIKGLTGLVRGFKTMKIELTVRIQVVVHLMQSRSIYNVMSWIQRLVSRYPINFRISRLTHIHIRIITSAHNLYFVKDDSVYYALLIQTKCHILHCSYIYYTLLLKLSMHTFNYYNILYYIKVNLLKL